MWQKGFNFSQQQCISNLLQILAAFQHFFCIGSSRTFFRIFTFQAEDKLNASCFLGLAIFITSVCFHFNLIILSNCYWLQSDAVFFPILPFVISFLTKSFHPSLHYLQQPCIRPALPPSGKFQLTNLINQISSHEHDQEFILSFLLIQNTAWVILFFDLSGMDLFFLTQCF